MHFFKRYLLGIIAFISSIIIGSLSLFHPNWLLLYSIFTYIFGYLLIGYSITPAGSITLGPKEDALPLLAWFGKLFLAQCVLFVFAIAAYIAFISQGPSLSPLGLSLNFVNNTVSDYTRWMWGIFPWGLYGFWGLILAYVVYVKKGHPYFYQLARGFFSKRLDPMIKSYIEGTVNGATMLALSLVACAIALLISYAIEKMLHLQHFEVPAMTYAILSFFMMYVSIKKGTNFFKRLTIRSRSYILFFSFMIIALAVLFILSGYANAWFLKSHPDLAKLQCEECRIYFKRVPIETRFAAIYWGWWVIWTPLAGSYLAKISKGRTIREFVIGLFALPAALLFIHFVWGTTPYENLWISLKAIYQLTFVSLSIDGIQDSQTKAQIMMLFSLGLLTVALFTAMLKHFKNSSLFSSGYMPVLNAKENRLWLSDAAKVKGISKVTQKLALLMVGTMFVHVISGWYGVQVEVLAMAILVLNAAYAGFHLIVIRTLKDRVWIGNRNITPFSNIS